MDLLVKKVRAKQQFEEETRRRRKEELTKVAADGTDVPPVFNKHHYSAKGTVVITEPAREIMSRNAQTFVDPSPSHCLSPYELSVMRGIVDVLRLIHRGAEYVKEVLSHVVTVETYEPYSYVIAKDHEDVISCYYVVYGLVEVTYDSAECSTSAVQVFEPNIIYTNGSGEYIGMVSQDGREHDMTAPGTIYTKANSLLVRVDRVAFHKQLVSTFKRLQGEKWQFLNRENGPLTYLSVEEKEKLLPAFTKMYFNPHKVIAQQDQVSDVMYIIVTGHCYCVRRVHLKDANTTCMMRVGELHPGNLIGNERMYDQVPYHCTVYTSTYTKCYKFHRRDLEALTKENLRRLHECNHMKIPDEELLHNKGYTTTAWRRFKEHQVTLVKEKDHGVAPLQLPLDVRWGTITPEKIRSKLFISFLAGGNGTSSARSRDHSLDGDPGTYDPGASANLSRSVSAHPARGKHPVYSTKRNHLKSAPSFQPSRHRPRTSLASHNSDSPDYCETPPETIHVGDEEEESDVVEDRTTYSSLGARDIVRQATNTADLKSRRCGSVVQITPPAVYHESFFSTITNAHDKSTTYCAFGRYRLELLRRRLARVKLLRRQMEEDRLNRTHEREFKMALRRPQISLQTFSSNS